MPRFDFDRFLRYDELTALLHAVAEEHPAIVTVESVGRSYEGRDIWLATLTDRDTGPHDEKPALWVDANIHATELAGSVAALHLIHHLVDSDDAAVRRALATRCFYVVPRVNPDGAEAALADRPRLLRSSVRPWPREDELEGLTREDVDGDGRLLQMRVPDPNGPWTPHADEPRLLVPVGPGEEDLDRPRYRLFPEGTVRDYDGVLIPLAAPLAGLDLNRNFPAEWRPEGDQAGAGPYPASEPEIRAVVQAVVDRPNICGYIAFHTYSGVHLRPYSNQPDDALPTVDLRTYKEIGRRASAITGYPAVSVFHDFRYDPKGVITGAADDWAYEHVGVFAWTTELWSPLRRAGIEGAHFIDWYEDHPVDDDLALLRWNDDELDGEGFVDWYPFDHPQLGPVELGGWNRLWCWTNPPPHLLEAEVAPHSELGVVHCLMSPRLRLRSSETSAAGGPSGPLSGEHGDAWRVRVVVENEGWLPTNVTAKAVERKIVRPVEARIALPDGASLVTGASRQELGQLTGRALKQNTIGLLPVADATTDLAKVEWVVRAPAGTEVDVEVRHQRAGVVRVALRLGE